MVNLLSRRPFDYPKLLALLEVLILILLALLGAVGCVQLGVILDVLERYARAVVW